MYLRAALTLVPRPRPANLPSTVVSFTATPEVASVAAYASVCGYPLADVLPPLYPHILAFGPTMRLMSGSDFPFPVVGLVHMGNRLTVHAPVPLDAALSFTVRAADLRPHRRGRQFDIVTRAALSPDGPPVWEETSTYLRRGPSPGGQSSGGPVSGEPAEEDHPSLVDGPPSAVWTVGRCVGREYAAVSGDHNPIHTSALGARAFGFPRPIAHGMWTKARLLASVRPPSSFAVDVRFRAPIFLGSKVSLYTRPGAADVRGRGDRLHLSAVFS